MTFIGYDKGSKGYLFMHDNNTVYPGSQGTFYEKWFPKCKLDENRQERPSEPIQSNPNDEPDEPLFNPFIPDLNIPFTSPDDDQSHPPNGDRDNDSFKDDDSAQEHCPSLDHPSAGNTPVHSPSPTLSYDEPLILNQPLPAPGPDPFSYDPDNILEWQQLNPGPRTCRAPACPGFIPTPVVQGGWRRQTGHEDTHNDIPPEPVQQAPSENPPNTDVDMDNADALLSQLVQEGEVDLQNYLLSHSLDLSAMINDLDRQDHTPSEWTSRRHYQHLPPKERKEWDQACKDEIDGLKK
ncbi:hypothetical protein GYMLUDRAFT_243758 [Collybiopsis luxurians FD-317 M1]|uniref:Uncharacterized protein n=1 Tax=Collybiopsis luxurians FD-317 M1 TaxID=944289 RepID=A0A0D0CXT8_9AGAR|nr:hypothetical protein GYMLUDRAFT_243758 [Collybiopsis luxurians FD-317 M1]